MNGNRIVETIGQLRGNISKQSNDTRRYNTTMRDITDALSILFNKSFDESPHLASGRMFRKKAIDAIVGQRTRVVAAVDNGDFGHVDHQNQVALEFERLKADFVAKRGFKPYGYVEMRLKDNAEDAVTERERASERSHRIGNAPVVDSDRLVQVFDNGTVDVLNLANGQIVTRMVASVPYLKSVIDTVMFDAMYNDKIRFMNRDERIRATRTPNSKQRKKIGNQISDLEALVPMAEKIDSVHFDPQILKGFRHWGNLGDFHNIDWDRIDDSNFGSLVMKPLEDAGLVEKKDDSAKGGIVECIAGIMAERNRLRVL